MLGNGAGVQQQQHGDAGDGAANDYNDSDQKIINNPLIDDADNLMMHDAIYQEKLQRRNLALVLRHNLLEADHKNREDRKKVEDAAAIADN